MQIINQKSWLGRNWLLLLVGALVLYVFLSDDPFGKVARSGGTVVTTSDTTDRIVQQPIIYVTPSTPQITSSTQPVYIPQPYRVPTPSGNNEKDLTALIEKYNEVVKKLLAENRYNDSLTLKDSSGNRIGVFNYNDLVSENEIKSRAPNYQINTKERLINTTTTITLPPELKNKFFILGEVTGNTMGLVNGGNTGIMWMNKKDQAYYLKGGGQFSNGQIIPQFGVGAAWKIKF